LVEENKENMQLVKVPYMFPQSILPSGYKTVASRNILSSIMNSNLSQQQHNEYNTASSQSRFFVPRIK